MKDDYRDDTSFSLGIGIGGCDLNRRETPIKLHELFPLRKRDRDHEQSSDEDDEDDDGNDSRSGRKKLKLTAEQASLLEQSFREHRTLTLNEKQILAEKLNLLPRQVEVWFQNRRARTKMKQTEVNYQLLKNYCERLSEENKKLKRELHELRALRLNVNPPQLHNNFPVTATLSLCSSCQRKGASDNMLNPKF